MNRREALAVFGGVSAIGLAAQAHASDHSHHPSALSKDASRRADYRALQAAALECIGTGESCVAKCLEELAGGDNAMAECAQGVNQMLAVCNALQQLAAQGASLTPSMAAVGLEACRQCADTCKPHNEHHPECEACYRACLSCIKECESVV